MGSKDDQEINPVFGQKKHNDMFLILSLLALIDDLQLEKRCGKGNIVSKSLVLYFSLKNVRNRGI